jgi:hypothetical protein
MIRPYLFWYRRPSTGSQLCVLTYLLGLTSKALVDLVPQGWEFYGCCRICEHEARQHEVAGQLV